MPRSTKVFKKRKGVYHEKKSVPENKDNSEKFSGKEKKIPDLDNSFLEFEESNGLCSVIMDVNLLADVFKTVVRCKACDGGLDLKIIEPTAGLSVSFYLNCDNCSFKHQFRSSGNHPDTKIALVNTRFVYAMRSIGKGAEAGRMFCAVMNLPQPPTRFAGYTNRLLPAVCEVAEMPQHGFCPVGEDSWCGYRKAEAKNQTYKHKNRLPVAVVEAMRPIFRDLSHPDLLQKCLHGKTQNPNESVNNVIWSRVPKSTFVHFEALSLGVFDAVCTFNDGNVSKLKVLRALGIEPGDFSVAAMRTLDKDKLMRARYAFSEQTREKRKEKRQKRKREEESAKKKPT